jgi:TRAP-type C4-dicarboxylate transport system permease small subunit
MVDRLVEGLDRGLLLTHKVLATIGCALLVGLMVCVNSDLLLRSVFRHPVLGMTEITEIFLLYMTFLGTAWVYREDGHVVVDLLLYEVYAKARIPLLLISHGIVGVTSLILVYFGSVATLDHFMRGVRNPSILETPIAIIIGIVPVGSLVLLLEVVLRLRRVLTSSRPAMSETPATVVETAPDTGG